MRAYSRDMANWLELLSGETRSRLLSLLRRSPQTITALSQTLKLTDNAVRTHIAALERDGIVKHLGTQRDTGGKPARLYSLTKEGEELFPKAYALVLGSLVEEITREDGEAHTVELLRAVGERMATKGPASKAGSDRVEKAAEALRALGGDIEVRHSGSVWRLQGHACPFSAVTTKHAEVCALAQAVVATIVGQPVRECCDRGERPRCAFEIEADD
jgi:predicted ArsR family transcriptional regulator